MKKYNPVLIAFTICALTASSVFHSSCSEPSPESAKDKTLKLLTGTWNATNVTVDGINENDSFNGFTLTFSSNAYSSSNGEPEWPTSGTWTFTDDTASSIVRDDDTVVEITSVTEGNLTLKLQWDQIILGGGRTHSTTGEYVFVLSR